MTYFPDRTPCTYFGRDYADKLIAIGWLDAEHPFPQAEPSPEFVARLWAFCRSPVNTTLGFHECEFCHDDPRTYLTIEQNGEKVGFGNAEIWVFGDHGKTYAAPTLIYHYVVRHHYNPPAKYIQAALTGPLPDTPEYDARAAQFDWGKRMLRAKRFQR